MKKTYLTLFIFSRIFDIERTRNCLYDKVEVFNGLTTSSVRLGTFCGSFRPGDIISTTNKMLLKLQSDDSKQAFGFVAIFNSISPTIAGMLIKQIT